MVKMRLVRMGDKKSPVYRIVVVDGRKAATGEYIDKVGFYDPKSTPRYPYGRRGKGEGLAFQGRSADRNGKELARARGRNGKIQQAQPFQNQDEEKEVRRFLLLFPKHTVIYKEKNNAGFN